MIPGETIMSGAPTTCPTCQRRVLLEVCRSGAGYYIGTYCDCGPYSRESGYYRSHEEAQEAFNTGSWEPRR